MTVEEILDTALCFAGRSLTEGEETALSSLCREAQRLWEGRLREGLTPADCEASLRLACAWTALGSFTAAMQSGAPSAFSVGDLSVSQGADTDAAAKSLLSQAETLMRPYTTDSAFAFLEVMG